MTDFAMSLATLRRAKGPEEVFGELPAASAGLRAEAVRAGFQVLARMLHPDRNGGSAEASEAMALLNAFRDQAEIKIKRGTWGQATSATSIAAGQTYVNVTPLAPGDVCDVYIGDYGVGRRAVIKVSRSPRDRDLVENEAKVLGGLLAKHGNEAAHFQKYLPRLIESARLKIAGTERSANIFEHRDRTFTLTQVMGRYRDGLDPRHVAWLWKRLLEGLDWIHRQGIVHGCITPDHILVFPDNHGIHLLDWSYAAKEGARLKAISSAYRAYYPAEVLAKKPLTPGADLYMVAKCVTRMLGGDPATGSLPSSTPRAFAGMLHASLLPVMHRYQSAFELLETLKKHLRALYGPPKFIELEM